MGKWDFDLDELVFFFIAGLISLVGFFHWYSQILRRALSLRSIGIRVALAATPPAAALELWFVLTHWADPKEVVGQLDYELLFLAGGLAWMWVIGLVMPMFGISAWDDALERANAAAAWVVCGALIGAMAIYSGSNIGAGPTIWTTLAPAFVATCAWLIVWYIVELVSRSSEFVAIDRDSASAIRLAAYLVSSGILLGRASGGDWRDWNTTWSDLAHLGWPIVLLALYTIVLGRIFHPTPDRPTPGKIMFGVIPTLIMFIATAAYLYALGPMDIGKHVVTYEQYMGQP